MTLLNLTFGQRETWLTIGPQCQNQVYQCQSIVVITCHLPGRREPAPTETEISVVLVLRSGLAAVFDHHLEFAYMDGLRHDRPMTAGSRWNRFRHC